MRCPRAAGSRSGSSRALANTSVLFSLCYKVAATAPTSPHSTASEEGRSRDQADRRPLPCCASVFSRRQNANSCTRLEKPAPSFIESGLPSLLAQILAAEDFSPHFSLSRQVMLEVRSRKWASWVQMCVSAELRSLWTRVISQIQTGLFPQLPEL